MNKCEIERLQGAWTVTDHSTHYPDCETAHYSCAINQLADEVLRLRQALWDSAKVCGADTDGDETPAALVSDIVEFALSAARDLRRDYDECLGEGAEATQDAARAPDVEAITAGVGRRPAARKRKASPAMKKPGPKGRGR